MAEKANRSSTLIILSSSSDEELENQSNNLKAKTLNSLGLHKSEPAEKRLKVETMSPSTSQSSTVEKNGRSNGSVFLDTDQLIEKFVSTLRSILKNKSEMPIIDKVYHLKTKCQSSYLQSEEFRNRLTTAIDKISSDPKNVFVYVKDVYDEMKAYRMKNEENGKKSEPSTSSEQPDQNANERHIHKLEKFLGKLDRKIRKLKAKDISLDEMDSSNSAYIYEDRLIKRFIKVWEKLCELKKRSARLKSHVNKKFQYNGSRYPEVNVEIEKFMNSSKSVPDYMDILKVTRTTNEKSSLSLSEPVMEVLAQEIFQDVGRELKHRRLCDLKELAGSYLTDEMDTANDPAESDSVLKETLEKSYLEGQKKEEKLMAEFTAKQVELKLEPEEVPDEAVADDDPERLEDPDDEEEDRLIESEQMEDEKYSDDEKIKRYLDEPDPITGHKRIKTK